MKDVTKKCLPKYFTAVKYETDVMFYDTFTEELCNIQYIEVSHDFITLVGS